MFSTKADPDVKFRQEMSQVLQSGLESTGRHNEVDRRSNKCRITKTLYCGREKCENNSTCVTKDSCLPEEVDIINRLEDDQPKTAEFSMTIKRSSDLCSASHYTISGNVNFNCNCDIMYRRKHEQISESYLCSIYNLWRVRETDKDLPLPIIKTISTQWRNFSWRKFLIHFVVLFLCLPLCIASSIQCAPGVKTPGRTWPQGDIILENGESLRILCEITDKSYLDVGMNASNLVFFRNKKKMEPEFITIINETTISLYVEKPPPAEDMYYCRLRSLLENNNTEKDEAVCLNKVVVGFKPQKPYNFSCVSHNWETMICSWDPVPNYVTTKYTLVFKLPGRAGGRRLYPCPINFTEPTSCKWDVSTNPLYRQVYEYYTFILSAENVLGTANFTYKFHHYAHVIPAQPANFSLVNKTSESALLHWNVPFPMQNFPPGLYHRIMYQNQWDNREPWQVINITNDVHQPKRFYNLTGLQYANTVYDARVVMKSAYAVGEDKWSRFNHCTFRTLPKLPGHPPKTDIGSFEIIESSASRDVYLYWQTIPPYLENGDDFRYEIISIEESGKKVSLVPNETTRTYAKFKKISYYSSYRFEIVTANVVGISKERTRIFIPSRYEIPEEPIAFTKIAFDGGLYELSWKAPQTSKKISNYTIFWCDNERDRPYQCTGYLDWVHVPNNTSIFNMTVPDPNKVYQFAISTNTNKGSSGMIWASCTVIHNKVVGKMKSVWINRIGSDFIEVGWKLDCSDRIGIVEGFNIYYCPIVSPHNSNCKGQKFNKTITDPHTIHGIVGNLKPYTTYMVAVAVLTKSGEGLHSDPLYNTTLEAAPTPPQEVKITNVTNSTMSIRWKSPVAMNGVLREYKVHYESDTDKKLNITQENSIELTKLKSYTNYSISVEACTVNCSSRSPIIHEATKIGIPGQIPKPNVRFINSSQVSVTWKRPLHAGGKLNYYEIERDKQIQNSTGQEALLPIPDCKTIGQEKLYQFRVRAVNVAPNNELLKGDWSEAGEGNCYSDGPSFSVWIMIWVIGGVSVVAVLLCIAHVSKRMWLKCKAMQDVEVKLPPGLTPNMKLLQKVGEHHIRQSSADSSGCSSGQESVTSSLTSDSHVSSDSGTETDPMPVSQNKLLETLGSTWESSSLRQRNTRPGFTTEAARWEPYAQVPKSGEPVGDTSPLARSTPNLTDGTGYTTSQHTWSSAGYISMPSSEELSSNPSPVPKETTTTGYSVISAIPKPVKSKSEDNRNASKAANTLVSIKSTNPYITLGCLEQKQKEKKPAPCTDTLRDLDTLSFTSESNQPELESLAPFSTSDNVPQSFAQTSLIDSLQSFTLSSIDSARNTTIPTSFAVTSLTDSCNTPFVSSYANQTGHAPATDSSSMPYVSISAIPEISMMSNVQAGSLEPAEPPQKSCKPPGFTTEGSQPYVLASTITLGQSRGNTETFLSDDDDDDDTEEEDSTTYPMCWQTGASQPSAKLEKVEQPITVKQNTGYVIIQNPNADQHRTSTTSTPYVQHEMFEKPLPQNVTDEQYSKVTVVPSNMP